MRSVTTLLALAGCLAGCSLPPGPIDPLISRRIAVADRVAAWLDARARPRAGGVDWSVDVDEKRERHATNLYHGTPGIILFYLEHHHATGRVRSLEMATAAASSLWARVGASLPRQQGGLYTGVAGIGFTFAEMYRTTKDPEDREKAVACVEALADSIRADGSWSPTTDVISGTAGIGLALLRLNFDLKIPLARELAVRAGDNLLALAEAVGPHMRWSMIPDYAREMPNFSHGTAGVAYFLARLHQATLETKYLRAARAGADYLLSITGDDGLIYHNQKSPKLHYLSFCHGPPGTARLFSLLHEITRDGRYESWVEHAAATIAKSRIPQATTAGFWNNHGQCCGTAGVVDFYLHRRARGGDDRFDARIDGMLNAIEASAKPDVDGNGASWTGAEHRVRPKLLSTQTGYTQGAAGIGLVFLHDAAQRRGAPRRIVLPDSPYPHE